MNKEHRKMDMDKLFARKVAERAAKGLVADDGIACANKAQLDYRNFRARMKARSDWGNLPTDLERKLTALRAAAR
jgi:hypothetical protein